MICVSIGKVKNGSVGKNSPDLRAFDLLAQKQTLAVHIAKRSKYKRLLSLHVDSMSSSGQKFKTLKWTFHHTFRRSGVCKWSLTPLLIKVFPDKKNIPYPAWSANAVRRQWKTEARSYGTLMRLHSAKDQWAGHADAIAPRLTATGRAQRRWRGIRA